MTDRTTDGHTSCRDARTHLKKCHSILLFHCTALGVFVSGKVQLHCNRDNLQEIRLKAHIKNVLNLMEIRILSQIVTYFSSSSSPPLKAKSSLNATVIKHAIHGIHARRDKLPIIPLLILPPIYHKKTTFPVCRFVSLFFHFLRFLYIFLYVCVAGYLPAC